MPVSLPMHGNDPHNAEGAPCSRRFRQTREHPNHLRRLPSARRCHAGHRGGSGLRGRSRPGGHRRRKPRVRRSRPVLRQHLSDAGPEEPAGQRLPAPERRRGRGGRHLPPGYLVRRRQDARPDRSGARGARVAAGGRDGRVHRCVAPAEGAGAPRGLRRGERGPGQRTNDGRGRPRAHAVGRAGLRARRGRWLRPGEEQRHRRRRAGSRHAARAVRRRADPHPARRALGVPPQGAADRCGARPVDRVPDVALQGGGGDASGGSGLHAGHRQGRPGGGRVLGREPVHRRPDGGGRERFGAQGDAAQSDRGGRDGPGAAPTPLRVHRRRRYAGRGGRLSGGVFREPRGHRRRRRPAGDGRGLQGELSVAPRGPADADVEDGDARHVPARPRHAPAAGADHRASLGDPARRRHRDSPASRGPRLRVRPAGDRHPPAAVRLRAGHRERRGRVGRCPRPRGGDRREAPRGPAALRGLRGAHDLHAHPGIQRAAQGAVAGGVALFDAGADRRRQLHRRGAEEVRPGFRLSRRPARRAHALPRRCEPDPDHPPRGEERRLRRRPAPS